MQKICKRKWKNGSSLNGTNFLNKTQQYVTSGLNGKTQRRDLPSHFWKILIGLGMRIDCFTTKSERYFIFVVSNLQTRNILLLFLLIDFFFFLQQFRLRKLLLLGIYGFVCQYLILKYLLRMQAFRLSHLFLELRTQAFYCCILSCILKYIVFC